MRRRMPTRPVWAPEPGAELAGAGVGFDIVPPDLPSSIVKVRVSRAAGASAVGALSLRPVSSSGMRRTARTTRTVAPISRALRD